MEISPLCVVVLVAMMVTMLILLYFFYARAVGAALLARRRRNIYRMYMYHKGNQIFVETVSNKYSITIAQLLKCFLYVF